MDLLFATLPLMLVIILMTKPKGWSAHAALGLAAALMYVFKMGWFQSAPLEVHASVVNGVISAVTPLSIVAGAILLFRVMGAGGAIDIIRSWLNSISTNPVAQLLVIGWAFAFLIEGASGFGTPAALAAPILVALGFPPVKAAIFCLVCNSVPTSFGAIGTPTWFGFGELNLSAEELTSLGWRTAILHAAAALVIPIIALRLVLPWRTIAPNLLFAYASIAACVIPYGIIAMFSYEFPSLVGGGIGLLVSVALAKVGFGLKTSETTPAEEEHAKDTDPTEQTIAAPRMAQVMRAFSPLMLTVLILILTRIPQLGIKGLLTSSAEFLAVPLGTMGTLTASQGLVFNLEGIFTTGQKAGYQVLYVPALIPFAVVALACIPLLGMTSRKLIEETQATIKQLAKPALALVAALIFVKLMMMDGSQSATQIIGKNLASIAGPIWPMVAAYLGALGSFFSGSNTIANLTFGPIQNTIAADMAFNRTQILALQSVGGAMGNMVCIHNIVAVCTVLGLSNKEGFILLRTVGPMLAYGIIVGLVGLLLL